MDRMGKRYLSVKRISQLRNQKLNLRESQRRSQRYPRKLKKHLRINHRRNNPNLNQWLKRVKVVERRPLKRNPRSRKLKLKKLLQSLTPSQIPNLKPQKRKWRRQQKSQRRAKNHQNREVRKLKSRQGQQASPRNQPATPLVTCLVKIKSQGRLLHRPKRSQKLNLSQIKTNTIALIKITKRRGIKRNNKQRWIMGRMRILNWI